MASSERYKGDDHVIAAVPDLVRRGHDIVYLIIGEGDDRARLEEVARKIGVSDRVRFLGAVDHQRLVAAYRMADLFVMPSAGEGFGICYLEAMARGTPALGLDVAVRATLLPTASLEPPCPKPNLSPRLSDSWSRRGATRWSCLRRCIPASDAKYFGRALGWRSRRIDRGMRDRVRSCQDFDLYSGRPAARAIRFL
jgi:phosphatidylinositol alpha-1,6-mannosyltransferase